VALAVGTQGLVTRPKIA